jgi:RNA polymerase sigma-70 factor (sigma-E family)
VADESFERFVTDHGRSLARFAFRVAGGDAARAEDLVQTTFLHLWRRWPRIGEVQDIEAYARRSIARAHVSFLRRRSSHEVPLASLPDAVRPDAYEATDAVDAVWRSLRYLPQRQRAVLALRYADDLSDFEIGRLLGVSESTVRSQAARGLASLRRGSVSERNRRTSNVGR